VLQAEGYLREGRAHRFRLRLRALPRPSPRSPQAKGAG
jgi:hypothetical protein